MSALRKEEPSSTTDAASQKRAAVGPGAIDRTDRTDAVDEPNIDPATRRPPQSVATPVAEDSNDRAMDDTYDGEIVSSTVEETPPSPQAGAARTGAVGASRAAASGAGSLRPDQNREPQPASRANQTPEPQAAASRAQSQQTANGHEETHLFDQEELRNFRARWDQVQTSFVDEPRHAVEQADALVGSVVKRISDQFAEERAKLEKQWSRGENVSTEDLRQGFRRYRAFFDRLLSF